MKTNYFLHQISLFLIPSLIFFITSCRSKPQKVFVLLFNANTDNEGIYTIEDTEKQRVVMFEDMQDAKDYNEQLKRFSFDNLTVEPIETEEVEFFCEESQYQCVLIYEDQTLVPPEQTGDRKNDGFW